MELTKIADDFFISVQLVPDDMATLADRGIRSIICNRPDGEETGQPGFDAIAQAAHAVGIQTRHIPFAPGKAGPDQVAAFRQALATLPGPVLGYCKTGRRAVGLHQAVSQIPA